MVTKKNIIDSFNTELSHQKTYKLFDESALLRKCSNSVMKDLSENDKSELTIYINNRIKYYKKHYIINNRFYLYNKHSIDLSYIKGLYFNFNKYINDILNEEVVNDTLLSDNDDVNSKLIENIKSLFPTISFASCSNIIYIPKTMDKTLIENMSVKDLMIIDKDVDVAREMILMFLDEFACISFYNENKDDWKYLSKYTMAFKIFGNDGSTARMKLNKMIEILEKGTKKFGSILEVKKEYDFTHFQQRKADGYRVSELYRQKGYKRYEIKTEKVKTIKYRVYLRVLAKRAENPIVRNQLMMYSMITVPTYDEVMKRAKELVGTKKKGKKYMFRGNRAKGSDKDDIIYLEDAIKCYEYSVTDWNKYIPEIGEDTSGGRLYDKLNMMPSWVRKLIKINGRFITEVDYHCLHPNIAMSLYGGSRKYLTHQQVGEESGLGETEVKIEHLSFFNKNRWSMENNSKLFDYYNKTEHRMVMNLFEEKKKFKYTITSKRMFSKEVAIMTDVIKQLNEKHIYVLYVFDALGCAEKDKKTVRKIMNETIVRHGVYTTTD